MKNTPFEIGKYSRTKNSVLKNAYLGKIFWSWNFEIEFFPL